MRCPVCRASIDSAAQCRRCRADLTLVRRVEDERSHLLAAARSHLAAVRLAPRAIMAAVAPAAPPGAIVRPQFVGAATSPGQVVVVGAVGALPKTIPAVETAPVLDAAEHAHRLRPDAESNRLLAITHLLRRDFSQAWRYYQQQRVSQET
jgi:hypothetical protein